MASVGRNVLGPLLFLNLVMYFIVLGFASWCLNRFINGQTYHPSKFIYPFSFSMYHSLQFLVITLLMKWPFIVYIFFLSRFWRKWCYHVLLDLFHIGCCSWYSVEIYGCKSSQVLEEWQFSICWSYISHCLGCYCSSHGVH